MIARRTFLSSIGFLALGAAGPAGALELVANARMRGSLDAGEQGLAPGSGGNQSKLFSRIAAKAAAQGLPLFLPPGTYQLSNVNLPENAHITGVPGASRIVYAGEGHLFSAENSPSLTLSGISIDGANRWLADYAGGLLRFRGIANLRLENLDITGASKHAIQTGACGGRIAANRISGAAHAGVYAVDSKALSIVENSVSGCGNGGILVHRGTKADDGTMISGNRVSRISATAGGTGENGNGINIFRADNVMVTGNHVTDCAFSAIRSNAGSNILMTGNQCLNSGETAIYSEFGFEGALVGNNIIDGAASGILIVNFNEGGRLATVTGNIVRNLRLEGPYHNDGAGFGYGIAAEADTVISANTIENAPRWGMVLGWGPYLRNIVASGNIIRQTPVGCAVSVVEGVGETLISGNLFQDIRDEAIAGYRWNEKVTGDLVAGADKDFARLTITGNRAA